MKMGYKFDWRCPVTGEEIGVGDMVAPGESGVYNGRLTRGKIYPVEELGVIGRDGNEAVLLTDDAGEKEYFILGHLKKVTAHE